MKTARFHPAARLEVRAAAAWYGERSPEAMHEFTAAVADALRSVRRLPVGWPTWRKGDVRQRVLRGFPYSLFYVVEEDGIVVLAVAHQKRRPGYWSRRKPR